MLERIDKRRRAEMFRARLSEALRRQQVSQAELSRRIGADRSTVSQLLGSSHVRLPNGQLVGECAAALGVSADWLLGLTDRPERTADLMAAALSMPEAERSSVDDQIFAWHREAAGYKIRHVPATLPDMLKTPDMLRWEYAAHPGRPDQVIPAMAERLNWLLSNQSDYEFAAPIHEMACLARAEGYYAGLPSDIRRGQLAQFIDLHERLYPAMRLHLFDARRVFSAPLTVFGPRMASLYLGRHYVVFRETDRVRAIAQHFDWLVREAAVEARDLGTHLAQLMEGLDR